MSKRLLVVLLSATVLALIPSAAFAHHVKVEGYQNCDGSVVYKVQSWMPENGDPKARTHGRIEVRIWPYDPSRPDLDRTEEEIADTEVIHTGHLTAANNFQFGGVYEGMGEQLDYKLRATPVGKWEDGSEPGEPVTVNVAIKKGCPPPSKVAPATTVAPEEPTEEPEEPAEPETEALPFTGSTTVPFLVGGLTLIVVGAVALFLGRRRGAAGDNA